MAALGTGYVCKFVRNALLCTLAACMIRKLDDDDKLAATRNKHFVSRYGRIRMLQNMV
jgi:hypothetical protein